MRKIIVVLTLLLCAGIPLRVAPAQATKALLLFGGSDHKTFLGCLNCVDTSADSVCNSVGKYGSDVASDSIWNSVGNFGSDVSSESPWNDVTSGAPIIVDRDGNSYGYFTTNEVRANRTRIGGLLRVLDYFEKTKDLSRTRDFMCR